MGSEVTAAWAKFEVGVGAGKAACAPERVRGWERPPSPCMGVAENRSCQDSSLCNQLPVRSSDSELILQLSAGAWLFPHLAGRVMFPTRCIATGPLINSPVAAYGAWLGKVVLETSLWVGADVEAVTKRQPRI